MAWVRLDDRFDEHPKFLYAGPCAGWVFIRSLAYANRQETDGYIPRPVLHRIANDFERNKHQEIAEALTSVGLWHAPGHGCDRCPEPEDGWQIHDYHQYQPSKAKRDEERAEARERMRRLRSTGHKESSEDVRAEPTTNTPRSSGPVPGTGTGTGEGSVANAQTPTDHSKYPERFEKVWALYPRKREKQKAHRAWKARVNEGVSIEDLENAVRNYAAECRAKGRAADYIKHGSTFFGPDKPYEDYLLGVPVESTKREEGRPNAAAYKPVDSEAAKRWKAMYPDEYEGTGT